VLITIVVVDASFHILAKPWPLISTAVPLAFSDGDIAKLNEVLQCRANGRDKCDLFR
jgi:hypothetical protein